MSEELTREEVLDLLARRKIGVDEAAEMLAQTTAVAPTADKPKEVKIEVLDEPLEKEPETAVMQTNNRKPRWLRVRVSSLKTGHRKVTVNIPMGIVRFGLGIAGRFSPEIADFDINEIRQALATAESGVIVDVQDEESDEHVEIYLE